MFFKFHLCQVFELKFFSVHPNTRFLLSSTLAWP